MKVQIIISRKQKRGCSSTHTFRYNNLEEGMLELKKHNLLDNIIDIL